MQTGLAPVQEAFSAFSNRNPKRPSALSPNHFGGHLGDLAPLRAHWGRKLSGRSCTFSRVWEAQNLSLHNLGSAAAFWGFSRGGSPENACIGGAISERNFCEICRRKSPQNTEKHKTKLCAEVPERPLPKDPFFQLLIGVSIKSRE